MKKLLLIAILIVIVAGVFFVFPKSAQKNTSKNALSVGKNVTSITEPLAISVMREKNYPGSEIVIEETLPDGSNYHQYPTSYKSDGLKSGAPTQSKISKI